MEQGHSLEIHFSLLKQVKWIHPQSYCFRTNLHILSSKQDAKIQWQAGLLFWKCSPTVTSARFSSSHQATDKFSLFKSNTWSLGSTNIKCSFSRVTRHRISANERGLRGGRIQLRRRRTDEGFRRSSSSGSWWVRWWTSRGSWRQSRPAAPARSSSPAASPVRRCEQETGSQWCHMLVSPLTTEPHLIYVLKNTSDGFEDSFSVEGLVWVTHPHWS